MNQIHELDALVLGGGIAGLWVTRRLADSGQVTALIERDALGGGQSLASQGMIHGGLKYALGGRLTTASEAIARAPERWRACIEGRGEIPLADARRLSDACWMWADAGLRNKLTALLASRVVRGRITRLDADAWPAFLAESPFEGLVYRLNEFVFDVPSLMTTLAAPLAPRMVRVPDILERLQRAADGFEVRLDHCTLRARRLILTAGAGNAELLARLAAPAPRMQRRPLHQVCVHTDHPHPVFGHCLTGVPMTATAAPEPRVTISSHPRAGGWTWYLGGALAATGVARNRAEQIAFARAELAALLPWVNLSAATFTTLRVDRAEPLTAGGRRPDQAFVHADAGLITAWPTKLSLTPDLGDRVLALMTPPAPAADARDHALRGCLAELPRPSLAPGFGALAA